MKNWVAISILFYCTNIFSQNYPHIEELRGLEDSLGNTQLFYRYVFPPSGCWSKSIYHLDVANSVDTLFIYDAASDPIGEGCRGDYVYDYEFFNSNFSEFIYGGYNFYFDPVPILRRYDGDVQLPLAGFGGITEIEISKLNEELVYVVHNSLYKSTDGGYNFTINLDSLEMVDNPMISLSKNDDSQIYGINENKLVRSEDEGFSYIIVDNSQWDKNSDLFYDADLNHIYGLSNYYVSTTQSFISNIFVSNDKGNPFTWNSIVSEEIPLKFAFDENQTGEIYYSTGKQIFKSTDYGTTFNLYKSLDRKVTGLYKKSGTNILYASTPLKIYEITPTDIQVIKELPIPDNVLNFYPLNIGNKWIYDDYTYIEGNTYHDIFIREVTADSILPNGKKYFQLEEHLNSNSNITFSFERIDTSNGLVYRYFEDPGLTDDEYLIEDLLADVGDTVWTSREFYDPYFPTVVVEQNTFQKWNLEKLRIIYKHLGLGFYTHSLTRDLGLDSIGYHFDFGNTDVILKGCIIDGVVYGDTTVVSVEDENPEMPKEFSLSQNYPNPFNPSTNIQYAIDSRQYVSLKVYDILGKEVAILVNEEKLAGNYKITFDASSLPSGIYFYQLQAGSFVQTRKMVLLK